MARGKNRKDNSISENHYSHKSGTGSGRSSGTGGKKRRRQVSLRKPVSAVLLVLMFLAFFRIQNIERSGSSDTGSTSVYEGNTEQDHKAADTDESAEAGTGTYTEAASEAGSGTYTEAAGETAADVLTPDMLPAYSGQPYADINGDVPFFTEEEMTSEAFHEYWPSGLM